MWLGIDASSWAQLWSGFIGSFVAAVIGGLVALMVVRLTNAHQSKVAARGRVITAIADFNASLLAIPRAQSATREALQILVAQAESASIRLVMEMDDLELATELSLWPLELGSLALHAGRINEEGDHERAMIAQRMLYEASRGVAAKTNMWARASRRETAGWADALERDRTTFGQQSRSFRP